MKIVDLTTEFDFPGTIISVGSFDGLHLGHKYIVEELDKEAKSSDLSSALVVLDPIPKQLNARRVLLTTFKEKVDLLNGLELDYLVRLPFDKNIRNIEYREFLEKILFNQLNANRLMVGYDHHLGHKRKGDVDKIRKVCLNNKIILKVIEPIYFQGLPIKSSRIRDELKEGHIKEANKMLGHNFFIAGKVVEGYGRGRNIGTPTANLGIDDDKLLPKTGVYKGSVKIAGEPHDAAIYIGTSPTFDSREEKHVEVHILNYEKNLYGTHLTVYLSEWIRDDKQFVNIENLKKNIEKDKKTIGYTGGPI